MDTVTILGIDPGLGTVGFGWLMADGADQLRVGSWGAIVTSKSLSESERLVEIYRDLSGLLEQVQPHVVAVERIFFAKNITTALSVSQARGVILMTLAQYAERHGTLLAEYTPMQVKQAITGYGKAKKTEVQQLVSMTFGLEKPPRPDDASDALAVAICHARMSVGCGLAR